MALPRAVQKQVDEANRIVGELQNPAPPVATAPVAVAPAVTAPVAQPTVVAAPAPIAPAPAAPQATPEDGFEHKYSVLRGKYDKEVPRLHRQVAQLNEQMDGLRALLADMQKQPPAPTPQARADSLLSPEEIEEYGPDLIDVIGRKARELYEPTFNELRSQVTQLKSQLGGVQQKAAMSDRDRVFSMLDDSVKDWRDLNENADFLAWLDTADPFAGQQRGNMLKQAFENNDAERVVAFFNGFLKEHAAITSGSQPASESNGRPAVNLADQVAPGRSKNSVNVTGARKEGRIWTRADVSRFYDDVRRGKFKSKDAERAELENDIVAAMRENRIR